MKCNNPLFIGVIFGTPPSDPVTGQLLWGNNPLFIGVIFGTWHHQLADQASVGNNPLFIGVIFGTCSLFLRQYIK